MIQTPELLASVHLYYPKFTWSHSGWIQDYDIQYSSQQWDDDPLQVHIVLFSHVDPGQTPAASCVLQVSLHLHHLSVFVCTYPMSGRAHFRGLLLSQRGARLLNRATKLLPE